MLALVTGGAGFIGSNVCRRLLARGHEVRILDNFSTGSRSSLAGIERSCEVLGGDLRDETAVRHACSGVDLVFHLAAKISVPDSVAWPVLCEQVNTQGTVTLLTAARDAGVRRLVFSSSAAVYGNAGAPPTDERQARRPGSPYAISKATGEDYCRLYTELFGLETVALRYFNVYGPGQRVGSGYAAVIPLLIQHALRETSPVIYGDGLQSRDFVFVEDVAAANVAAATAPGAAGEVFNVGTGQGVTLLDLLTVLRELTGAALIPEFQAPRVGDVRYSIADISRARRVLGYEPSHSVRSGLLHTMLETLPEVRSSLRRAA
jgi:nucleoside-diphosphate-sugar epimerase